MDQFKIQLSLILIFLTVITMVGGIVVFIFQYRKRRLDNIKEQQQMQKEHQHEMLTTQLEIQQQTMQYIGREIHDNVGQKLTLASLYAQQMGLDNKTFLANNTLNDINQIINESLSELRQLSKTLTNNAIAESSIEQLINQECERVNATKKCQVIFTNSTNDWLLPYQTKSILLRISQEFLQNSLKHSYCQIINITLSGNANQVQLCLQDDGAGFNMNENNYKGIGLSNMKKRTELLGGTFMLESEPNKGTKLNLLIPISFAHKP